jgi:hypothetical protein
MQSGEIVEAVTDVEPIDHPGAAEKSKYLRIPHIDITCRAQMNQDLSSHGQLAWHATARAALIVFRERNAWRLEHGDAPQMFTCAGCPPPSETLVVHTKAQLL